MSELRAYNKKITNVFQLSGTNENDITMSIAWAMAKCPIFLKQIVKEVLNINIDPKNVRIICQNYEKNKGITDLELTDDIDFYMIIEAKKGWVLPNRNQLTLYSKRDSIKESRTKYKAIVSMSECSIEYAHENLPFHMVNEIPVSHLPWSSIYKIASESKKFSGLSQKNLLNELLTYLGGIMSMQEKTSNWVYVVSLSARKLENCNLTWIEIVEKKRKYFHPMGGNGWPKQPPNYIAFRYRGKLQSIHHIESYVVTKNLHDEIAEMQDVEQDKTYFVYKLGAAIVPSKDLKTGNIYASGRKWAMLDTLFTADTIEEACNISKLRIENDK